jgi:CubicO group peptidase (beta-lactamase class C family)
MRDLGGGRCAVLGRPGSRPVVARGAAVGFEGFASPEFAAVARSFAGLFGSPSGGGGSLVVRWRGETVVDVWKGFADPACERPWTRDTLALACSTAKGVASTVIHRLADRGLIDYDEPVATYWPEFAANGKDAITVRDVLSHRAGLYDARAIAPDASALLDHLAMEDRLAQAIAEPQPCQPAYHGLTYGWLLAGLARRVTGDGMAELVRSELAVPLGVDGMHIGAPTDPRAPVAQMIGSQLQVMGAGARLAPITHRITPARRFTDALMVPGVLELLAGPEPRILQTEWPSASGLFTASALATLYGALANYGETDNGRRLLSPETVHELGRVQTRARDRVLGLRVRWRLGYHQAVSIGTSQPKAFGHYGFGGSGGSADPTTGLSLGFVTNKIAWRMTPIGDPRLFRLTGLTFQAASGCPR